MEEFQMTPNSKVTLSVSINSDAVVGSNVSINDKMIKKSIAYKFTTELGNSNDLKNKVLTSFSNFSTHGMDANSIIKNTKVTYTINDGANTKSYEGTLVGIDDNLYTMYLIVKLK
jgi:hypothetical protein